MSSARWRLPPRRSKLPEKNEGESPLFLFARKWGRIEAWSAREQGNRELRRPKNRLDAVQRYFRRSSEQLPVAEGAQRDSVAASSRSFASPQAAKLTPSAAAPFPTEPAVAAAGLQRGPRKYGSTPRRMGGRRPSPAGLSFPRANRFIGFLRRPRRIAADHKGRPCNKT